MYAKKQINIKCVLKWNKTDILTMVYNALLNFGYIFPKFVRILYYETHPFSGI